LRGNNPGPNAIGILNRTGLLEAIADELTAHQVRLSFGVLVYAPRRPNENSCSTWMSVFD